MMTAFLPNWVLRVQAPAQWDQLLHIKSTEIMLDREGGLVGFLSILQ